MTIRERVNSWGGRKFTLAAFVIAAAFAFRALGYLTGSELVTLVLFALGLFSTANVAQKATAKESNGQAPQV